MKGCHSCRLGKQQGFTYIGVLVIMAVMLAVMGAASEIWHTVMQREKEQELLFIGHQFRSAIGKYYVTSGNKFPPTIESLLESTDATGKKVRFLRKLYRDPITNDAKWGLILGVDSKVTGIYSLSEDQPYKVTGFLDADVKFEGVEKYSDWKFVYIPPAVRFPTVPVMNMNSYVAPQPRIKSVPRIK
jgi:type II secretory pathway pseudopilin PulG